MRHFFVVLFVAVIAAMSISTAGIRFSTQSIAYWNTAQIVSGKVESTMDRTGELFINGVSVPFSMIAATDSFAVAVTLRETLTKVVARVDSAGVPVYSDTLRLYLGYTPRPEVYAYASVNSGSVQLHVSLFDSTGGSPYTFRWTVNQRNPSLVTVNSMSDSASGLSLPAPMKFGSYFFTVAAVNSKGDTTRGTAMFTADSSGIHPFDIHTDHAPWIDSAIVYGVDPSIFMFMGRFTDITGCMQDLVKLGINTIWLQPVYSTYRGGQGYDVTDYFSIRSDLGTESDLRTLITTAHANGVRVIFDFVPNHTSIFHPYALNATQLGTASHYYNFYQRTTDTAPYSQYYQSYQGFINYFWNELPNLNYENIEVRNMIMEAGKYWVNRLDIDGYRVDVAWGVTARRPDFFQQWRLALKRIKPDLLLLGEDKATVPSVFDQRFDAAYDWAPEQSWVSHWTWQTTYSSTTNPTIFNNGNETQRPGLLRSALTNNGTGYAANAKVFHFMENNDTFRFLATHDMARTRMVAAMLFTLPGIPSIFNGQEIGASTHPYNASSIFTRGKSIPQSDPYGLFNYYSLLTSLRKRYAALTSTNMAEVTISPSTRCFAYRRWQGNQNVFTVMNLGSVDLTAQLTLPVASLGLDSLRTYYLTDQLTNASIAVTPAQMSSISLSLPGFAGRIFILDTTVVTSVQNESPVPIAGTFALEQNYPNPFNPSTTISFQLAARSTVKLAVFDILGREVAVLAEGTRDAGSYTVAFHAERLASGVYFSRLEAGGSTFVKKMLLLK